MTEEDKYMFEKFVYWTKEEVECYNAGIEHCIQSIKEFSKTNTLANDPFLYYVHLVSKIEQLKKDTCPKCNGTGSYEGKTGGSEGIPESDVMFVCNECKGTGKINKQ